MKLSMAEHELKAILANLGIKVPPSLVLYPGDPLPPSLPFGYPVVAKVSSTSLFHKTEAGALRLNVADPVELAQAIQDLRALFPNEPLLVEAMERPGVEAIVGFFHDPTFGLCVMVGVGGIYAELYQDVVFRRLPVTAGDVEAMLNELRGRALFEGFRGMRASRQALVEVVLKASRWVQENARSIGQMDLNPVFVREEDAVVIDAKLLAREEPTTEK
ncbi:MAG: acetate--CoA ligase family protein [Armatimonadota bacterium]|nr:acetate--CoA ligase family protein [Armatimonadota bacterium]